MKYESYLLNVGQSVRQSVKHFFKKMQRSVKIEANELPRHAIYDLTLWVKNKYVKIIKKLN